MGLKMSYFSKSFSEVNRKKSPLSDSEAAASRPMINRLTTDPFLQTSISKALMHIVLRSPLGAGAGGGGVPPPPVIDDFGGGI